MKATDTANNEITSAIVPYPDHLDTPRVLDAICRTNKKSEFVCRIALATQNGAIVQLQAGKRHWNLNLLRKHSILCLSTFR